MSVSLVPLPTEYVVGFLFRAGGTEVALIQKLKPAWQAGKLNGVGGKVERGETPHLAMWREFLEETTARVPMWRKFCVLTHRDNLIHFFASSELTSELVSCTDERVQWYAVDDVRRATIPVIPNLRWLVPLALDHDGVFVAAEDPS